MKQIFFIFIAASVFILSGCEASVTGDEAAMARANAQAEASRAQAEIAQAQAQQAIAIAQTQAQTEAARLNATTTNNLIAEIASSRRGVIFMFMMGVIAVIGLSVLFIFLQQRQHERSLALLADMAQRPLQPTLALLPGWTPALLNDLQHRAAQQRARVIYDERGYLVELPTGQRVRALLEG